MCRLFLILLSSSLDLLSPSELLAPILPLLPLLSAGFLDLGRLAHSHKSVPWLEFLHGLNGVVDQRKTRGLATAVLGSHAEDVDLVGVGLVDFGQFGAEVVLGDVGAVGVEDVAGRHMLARSSDWDGGMGFRGGICACPPGCVAVDCAVRVRLTQPSAFVIEVGL